MNDQRDDRSWEAAMRRRRRQRHVTIPRWHLDFEFGLGVTLGAAFTFAVDWGWSGLVYLVVLNAGLVLSSWRRNRVRDES